MSNVKDLININCVLIKNRITLSYPTFIIACFSCFLQDFSLFFKYEFHLFKKHPFNKWILAKFTTTF